MSHFAEIDENGIVLRVIVAEQDFIDLELPEIGPKENWIQTSYNHNIRRTFAGIGWKYHKEHDCFLHPHEIENGDEIALKWKRENRDLI